MREDSCAPPPLHHYDWSTPGLLSESVEANESTKTTQVHQQQLYCPKLMAVS